MFVTSHEHMNLVDCRLTANFQKPNTDGLELFLIQLGRSHRKA